MASGESTVFRKPKLAFDPDDYETTQVFYTSKDGTKIPMFLSHKKGLKRDGTNPTLALRLRRVQHLADAGVQPEQPGLDGDGRRLRRSPTCAAAASTARTWHKAGTKLKKQNVFDDFIAAAEWLIEQQVHVARPSWRSPAARTAACSSAPA